jgi:hypothetical protein
MQKYHPSLLFVVKSHKSLIRFYLYGLPHPTKRNSTLLQGESSRSILPVIGIITFSIIFYPIARTAYGSLFRRILLILTIRFRAMAMIARFAPFILFNLSYFFRTSGSLVIRIQQASTAHVLTLLLPHLVILP